MPLSEPGSQLPTSFVLSDRSGFAPNLILTLSPDTPHALVVILHLNIYVLPRVPEKVEAGLVGSPKEPPVPVFPDAKTQPPVPTVGVLAASVVVVALQRV